MLKQVAEKGRIIWPDNSTFFTTSATFLHFPYFRSFEQKQIVLHKIKSLESIPGLEVIAFSVSMNHFHLMTHAGKGILVSKMKSHLHGGITREYRKSFDARYPEIWQGSRTYWIKDEESYWGVLGYVAGNLLKHKEVGSFQELQDCPFSSFSKHVKEIGSVASREIVSAVIAVNETAEGVVDLEGIRSCKIPLVRRI